MAYYIKANPKVAEFLGKTRERVKLSTDGNYMLWQADMAPLGRLSQLDALCKMVGALKLTRWEAMQEFRGMMTRPLPAAADPRFYVEPAQKSEIENETEEMPTDEEQNNEYLPIETENGEIVSVETEVEPENEEEL